MVTSAILSPRWGVCGVEGARIRALLSLVTYPAQPSTWREGSSLLEQPPSLGGEQREVRVTRALEDVDREAVGEAVRLGRPQLREPGGEVVALDAGHL